MIGDGADTFDSQIPRNLVRVSATTDINDMRA
jgi:hypothetical protein